MVTGFIVTRAPFRTRAPLQTLALATMVVATSLAPAGLLRADGASETAEPAPLKWTPHRAATATRPEADEPVPPPAQATVDPADAAASTQPAPLGPPASVSLPPHVPAAVARGPVSANDSFAPLRSRPGDVVGDWSSVNRIAGRVQQAFDPSNLSTPRLRSPEPPAARMALARSAAPGAAPPGTAAAPARRPERLAMNVDGIPSVMTQAPQVGALDDARVPGRSAGAPRTAQMVPSPTQSFPDAGTFSSGDEPTIIEMMPGDYDFDPATGGMGGMGGGDDLLLGGFPTQLHVESFYDDPYACEDDECGLEMCNHHGAICNWLRQFGRPYYGWRWYRDFTVGAGVVSFTNSTDLGINGNYGVNEYVNWSMPFWNAFGIGWQVGARAVQSNFQHTTLTTPTSRLQTNSREQIFVTTGFFTRAFEGRGLQGGVVYDYLNENFFEDVDIAQLRAEISYVWGYHEAGFWSATNIGDETGIFGPVQRTPGQAGTLDLYCGFYRLQFGDANEWKVWGGGTGYGDGVVGSSMRAPLSRSWALEGTFTYVIPKDDKEIVIDDAGTTLAFSPAAWNVGVNLVYYPAARARRSLASPYRPLFDVADNGSMIRKIRALPTP
jgi:hypothetical protein